MTRSIWKGPFVHPSLLKKIDKIKDTSNKKPIKTWSRNSTIIPEFVGHSFMIHNGKTFIHTISEEMVGHKLGVHLQEHLKVTHQQIKKQPRLQRHQLRKQEAIVEKNNLIKAINKNVRSSPRKLALVCNFIKGKKADLALRDLEFTRKRIAKDVSKTVRSAISNAENNYQYDIDNLFVKEAYVGKSLVMKRFRPRAKGRASPIKKPFSRITIILEEKKMIKNKKETK